MTLSDFLSTLRTKNVTVTINDLQDNLVCKIDAASVSALSDDLESRIVNRWNVNGATAISCVINDKVEETNNTDNTDNSGDNTNNGDNSSDPSSDPADPNEP